MLKSMFGDHTLWQFDYGMMVVLHISRQLHTQRREHLSLLPMHSLRICTHRPWHPWMTQRCCVPEHRALPNNDHQCKHILGTTLVFVSKRRMCQGDWQAMQMGRRPCVFHCVVCFIVLCASRLLCVSSCFVCFIVLCVPRRVVCFMCCVFHDCHVSRIVPSLYSQNHAHQTIHANTHLDSQNHAHQTIHANTHGRTHDEAHKLHNMFKQNE